MNLGLGQALQREYVMLLKLIGLPPGIARWIRGAFWFLRQLLLNANRLKDALEHFRRAQGLIPAANAEAPY